MLFLVAVEIMASPTNGHSVTDLIRLFGASHAPAFYVVDVNGLLPATLARDEVAGGIAHFLKVQLDVGLHTNRLNFFSIWSYLALKSLSIEQRSITAFLECSTVE